MEMKRKVAGSITSFFPVLGRKSKRACPKETEAKSNELEETSSSQADQAVPQADHNKLLSDFVNYYSCIGSRGLAN